MAQGVTECQGKMNAIPGAVESFKTSWAASLIPANVISWSIEAANSFMACCSAFLGKCGEFLHGIAMPVMALVKMWDWNDVQREAARISEATDPSSNLEMQVHNRWKGPAATAYSEAIKPQSGKALRISQSAGKVSTSLGLVGAAGLAFYVALGLILVKFIIGCVAVIAAFGSVAFSWAGLLLAIEEGAINTGMVVAAVTALTACLAVQVQQASSIKADLDSAFPTGSWPSAATSGYSDASMGRDSVGPQDDSDWRLQP